MLNNQYKFHWKAINYLRKQGKEFIRTQAFIIVIVDKNSGEVYPHPITHFLYKFYHRHSGSINTEKSSTVILVTFLNFVLERVSIEHADFHDVRGLADLKEDHANLYLKYCVEEKANNKKTLEIKENHLSKFYKYLLDENVLKSSPNFNLVSVRIGREMKKIFKMNFLYKKTELSLLKEKVKRKDIVPQSHSSSNERATIRLLYIREILLIAKQETPDIAFAIALQIFGGLRKGEIINLVKTALKPQNGMKYGEGGLIVLIRDRQDYLFNRLNDKSKEQVKNPRDQSILIDPILCYLFQFHMDNVIKKIKNTNHNNALFYDKHGNPMTSDTFDQRFLKLKNIYLGMLLATKGRYQDYLDFSETKWRSHIGRGIFTNMCLDAGFNEKQTAVLRGDKSTQSMESYFDIISATYSIRTALNLLSPENANNLSDLNMPFYNKKWKDVQNIGSTL